ncbi:uncharacterized protein LOC126354119 [Schistocerca gregaria]|uniref:uncharacterized protein LOC126354119 n=1 Tax=Schistocerca gregaria TaxID=7010 RepID=UPI00211E3957|nr:uncharacterized protein LOC126354119 [Schistocerca gregaria]
MTLSEVLATDNTAKQGEGSDPVLSTGTTAVEGSDFPPLVTRFNCDSSARELDVLTKKRPLEHTDDHSDDDTSRQSPAVRKQKAGDENLHVPQDEMQVDLIAVSDTSRSLPENATAAADSEKVEVPQAVTTCPAVNSDNQLFTDGKFAEAVEQQHRDTATAQQPAPECKQVKVFTPEPENKQTPSQASHQPKVACKQQAVFTNQVSLDTAAEAAASSVATTKSVPAITTTEFPPLSVITSHPSVPGCDLQNKKRPLETTDDGSDGESARNSPSTRKQKQCNADVLEETNSTCIDVTTAAEATRPLSAAEQVQTVHGGDAVTIVAETEEAHSEAQEVTERNPTQELTDPQTADSVSALELVTEEQGNGTRKKDAVEAASVTTVVKIDNPNDGALNQDVRRRRLKPLPTLKASRNQSKQQPAQEEATAKNVLYEIITERPKEVPSSDISDAKPLAPAITTTEFPPLSVITSHPSVPGCDLQNKKRPLETTDDGSDGESARNSPSTRKQKQCNADVLEETNSTCIDVTTAAEATRPLSAAEQVQTVHGGDAVTIVAETEEAHSEAQEVTERNPTQELTDPQTADSVSALELVTEEQGNGTRKKDAVEAASVTTVVKIDNPNDGALNQDVRRRRPKPQPNLKASRNQSKQQPAQEEATAKNVLYEIITERPKEVPSSDISDAKPLGKTKTRDVRNPAPK